MNKTALITGASSGIGLELAGIFASNGHDLILVARDAKQLTGVASNLSSKYKINTAHYTCDLADLSQVEKLILKIQKQHKRIDFLVNNAGFGSYGMLSKSNNSTNKAMIDLNITAVTHLTNAFLPQMIKAGSGRILNVASMAGFLPGPGMAVYSATKAYVLHFSEALASEVAGSGVTVTALCPGPTASKFASKSMGKSKLFKNKHLATAESVANFGYQAMMTGKTVAVHGARNKITVFMTRLLPRNTVVKLVKKATVS